MSLISGIEKIYASEGYFMIFYRKIFVSQSRKISYRNPSLLCFRKVLVAIKFFVKKGGGYQDFASKYFCLTVTKIAVGKPFSLPIFSGIEKVWMRGWGGAEFRNFPTRTSFLTVPEFFVKTFRVSQFSGLEKFHASEGYVTFFCRNFLCHSVEKFCMGTLLCCVSEKFR